MSSKPNPNSVTSPSLLLLPHGITMTCLVHCEMCYYVLSAEALNVLVNTWCFWVSLWHFKTPECRILLVSSAQVGCTPWKCALHVACRNWPSNGCLSVFMEPLGSALVPGSTGTWAARGPGPSMCQAAVCDYETGSRQGRRCSLSCLVAPWLRSHSSLISAVRRNPIPLATLQPLIKHSVPGQPE